MINSTSERERQVLRLQQNLSSIRRVAGWSAETLGNKIGVTKQTISNLENHKTKMSFTQYIALRSVLESEIASNKENEVLPKAVALLLDSDDELDGDDYTRVQEVVGTVASTAAGGATTAQVNSIFNMLIASVPMVVPIIGAIIASSAGWWRRLLN